uniref:DUF659 domain-containing protein n=1 Tax=Amphimedon queenslandica TaxID=400682 RepID=A0A1X7U3B7_AMPQE
MILRRNALATSCHKLNSTHVPQTFWTSRAQHAYISLTIYYLAGDFTLHSHLLESKEFPDSHSGVNIAQELTQSLKEWGLTMDKLVSFTTDNASNVVVAMEELECIRVPCFSHCLNLAVEKACSIAVVCNVIARCRRLVTHFHHSSKDTYILKQKQTDLHVKKQNLIQDVTTM